jgi:hypothetical protein
MPARHAGRAPAHRQAIAHFLMAPFPLGPGALLLIGGGDRPATIIRLLNARRQMPRGLCQKVLAQLHGP